MNKQSKDNLVWIDMEMTGLNPEKERIIEVATIVTDGHLKILEEGPDIVIHQSNALLERMDEWNQKQHKKTGLLEEVKKSKITTAQAEKQTLEFIEKYCEPGKSPLCGNSVHHDRKFIARYMPKLDTYLHYRHIDVSTIKGLVERWYDKKFKNMIKKDSSHRALSDIRQSIEELEVYRKKFFKNRVTFEKIKL